MPWTTLGTVSPGDVLRANSGTAAYNSVIGNVIALREGDWNSYTPTLTLTGLTLTYADQLGYYQVTGGVCSAYFRLRITAVSGTHASPFLWTSNLPVAAYETTGFTFAVSSFSTVYSKPAGYGGAICMATSGAQNLSFWLSSSTQFVGTQAANSGNPWLPSPTTGSPQCGWFGTLNYRVA